MSLDEMPIVNWPDKAGVRKAVQIRVEGDPYVHLGFDGEAHGTILREFLEQAGLAFNVTEVRREFMPLARGEDYEVVGMGFATVFPYSKKASFSGMSGDYQMHVSESHLDDIAERIPDWTLTT